jgi:hypothetical protein
VRDPKHFAYFEELNYFIYTVGRTHPDGLFKYGDCGVGYTMFGPGIQDCPYGTLYVIPRHYIRAHMPSAASIKQAVLKYYGINFYEKARNRNYLKYAVDEL